MVIQIIVEIHISHQLCGPPLEYGEGEVVDEHVLGQRHALKPVDVRPVARLLDPVRRHYRAASPDEARVAHHGTPEWKREIDGTPERQLNQTSNLLMSTWSPAL